MARYTDGNDWYECTEFEGILFAMTADEKAAIVEVLPAAVEATADGKDVLPAAVEATADGNDVLPAAVEATADEKASAVDVHPAIKVTIMETEYYYEEATGLWQHFFDVYLDDVPATLKLAAIRRQIKEIVPFS